MWFGRIVLILAWCQLWDGVIYFGSPLVVYVLLAVTQGLVLIVYFGILSRLPELHTTDLRYRPGVHGQREVSSCATRATDFLRKVFQNYPVVGAPAPRPPTTPPRRPNSFISFNLLIASNAVICLYWDLNVKKKNINIL